MNEVFRIVSEYQNMVTSSEVEMFGSPLMQNFDKYPPLAEAQSDKYLKNSNRLFRQIVKLKNIYG